MFSRWYSLFLGYLLIVLGIAGLIAAGSLPGARAGLVTTSIIWLVIALVSFWFGYGVRNMMSVRWYAGIIGGLLFLWGIIQMIAAPSTATMGVAAAMASVAGFLVFLGALGLAAATVPVWVTEMPARAA